MATPTLGDIVRVRSRQWLVEAVDPPPAPADATLVHLACLDDDAQGERLSLLWEREIDARLLGGADWARIASRGFDAPHLFSGYLHTLRWSTVTATDPKLFQAPYRAGIEVKAYQVEPLRKGLGMPRVNLFIADDVGLGKTIEAGLVLRELLMRQKVRRVVVCVPPSVVRQWKDEMEERFGLTFTIHDRDHVTAVRQQRGYAINPWTTHNRFIVSHALVRDEAYAAPLRDWLDQDTTGSLLVLDEAHNAAPASSSRYAIDSKLTRVMRDLCPRFEHKLFLSATPHNGHSNSFSALLELLDPQKFCRGVPVDPRLRDAVMVRRLKSDLRALGERFPERQILRVEIDRLPDDAPELALSRLLQRYRALREARLETASRAQQASAMLVVTSLQKRLLSSIEAFARTLEVHRRSIVAKAEAAPAIPRQVDLLIAPAGADDERADLPEPDVEREDDAQVEAATRAAGAATPEELALLAEMSDLARRHRYEPDPRLRHLVGSIRQHLCPSSAAGEWLPRRVLVFTEYADTKRYLEQQLAAALRDTDRASERVATFHGGMGDDRKDAVKAAFNADPSRHPLRVLIATDAAREGVNLQNHCADLFHFDVPWNPGRLEQRNGRIDRKLQQSPVVRCHYFVLPQRAEDKVLDVLVRKTRTIHEELGSLSPVIERRLDEALRGGIRHADLGRLVDTIERADHADAAPAADDPASPTERVRTMKLELGHDDAPARRARLERELATLDGLLGRAKAWIGLDDVHFREALSASLETLGAGRLEPLSDHEAALDPERARWRIPNLHERKGADPGWAATLDSLRAPRKKGQSPAEWRRDAPIRPVVFRDPGNLDGEVVHLHLEHRVVQRLLGRFVALGFREDDLARACVLRTDATRPEVVLLGRLSLFGDGGARLHDEVLAAAAEWVPPGERGKKGLKALGEGDKQGVLARVEESLGSPRLKETTPELRDMLRAHAPADVAALTAHLEARAQALAERATRELAKRAEVEAKEMAAILEAQRARIEKRKAEVEAPSRQLALAFDPDERRQLESDRHHWDKRLVALAAEITREPERIRNGYGVRATRVEPVGLVYLWPVSR